MRLTRPVRQADTVGLADVLVDAVESGASVSFLPPFGPDQAQQWWRDTLASADVRKVFVVARDEVGIRRNGSTASGLPRAITTSSKRTRQDSNRSREDSKRRPFVPEGALLRIVVTRPEYK
jgi:hypothetical protein